MNVRRKLASVFTGLVHTSHSLGVCDCSDTALKREPVQMPGQCHPSPFCAIFYRPEVGNITQNLILYIYVYIYAHTHTQSSCS